MSLTMITKNTLKSVNSLHSSIEGDSDSESSDEDTARRIAAQEMVRSQQNPDQRHVDSERREGGGNQEQDTEDDERMCI